MSAGFDLKTLLVAAEAADAAPPATPPDPASRLRLRLALRGWARPLEQIMPADTPFQDRILSALAADVETSVEARPGEWYLASSVRRRILNSATLADMRLSVVPRSDSDRADPQRRAFELWLSAAMPPLPLIESDVLAGLANVRDWLGEKAGILDPQQITAELANRKLNHDLDRMTKLPLVGQTHKSSLNTLLGFVKAGRTAPITAIYIHGGGGSGKTTLLSFLQRDLLVSGLAKSVARLDFDEPMLDPSRMSTLNTELYSQLTRTVPNLGPRRSFILEQLNSISALQRGSRFADVSGGARKKAGIKRASANTAETAQFRNVSDQASILYGTLSAPSLGGPLILILDTAELILAQSDRAAVGIVNWLNFLKSQAGAEDIRLIIAGRDPPPQPNSGHGGPAVRDLLQRLADQGVRFEPPIALPELEAVESAELLRNCGIRDERIAQAAADAVPGNPLLLRITADALLDSNNELQDAVHEAHRALKVDPASARQYLMRRIVAHVPDPEGRPYVLNAIFSPIVTRKLLEEAIIPATDRAEGRISRDSETGTAAQRQADRVFRALASAQWLTRPSLDGKSLSFNRDLRAFVLKLQYSGVVPDGVIRDIRQSCAIHHLRRRDATNRALACYQLALLGTAYTRPRDREMTRNILRDVLEELPADLRLWLDPPEAADLAAPAQAGAEPPGERAISDEEWLIYLEGGNGRDGEGMNLVKDDNARQALELYQSRPTRPRGLAPPFVVRAIADLGRWDDPLVDIEAILAHEGARWTGTGKHTPDDLSQIYWITRLALQRDSGRLSDPHVAILQHVARTASGPGLTLLPALIVVAEAARQQPIMDDRMRSSALKSGAEARILLGAAGNYRFGKIEIQTAQLAVAQRDWTEQFAVDIGIGGLRALSLGWAQSAIDELQDQPIAMVDKVFDKLTRRVTVNIDNIGAKDLSFHFRGRTPEFYRPLREALLTICGDGLAGPLTRSVVDPVLRGMSVRPAEMQPEVFYNRLQSNPRAWTAALISFADHARLLPRLASGIIDHVRDDRAVRIAQSYREWDRILCRGGSSLWPSNANL